MRPAAQIAYDARMSASRKKNAYFDRDVAAYTLAEAARYARLHRTPRREV